MQITANVAHSALQFGVLSLGMNEVEEDVECAGEDKGKEETEPGQVHITLGAEERA